MAKSTILRTIGKMLLLAAMTMLATLGRAESKSDIVATVVTGSAAIIRWGRAVLRQEPEWYASAEARAVSDSVIQYQSPQGGWPKSTDLASPPRFVVYPSCVLLRP